MPFQTIFPFSVNGSRNQESSSTTSKDAPSPADKVTNVLQSRALEDRATSSTTPRNSRPLANELLGAHPADFVPQEYTTTKAAAKPRRGEESDSKFYSSMCEFISGRLYFDSIQSLPFKVPEDAHIFTIDQDFNYVPFYADFGPLNMSSLYRFCELINAKMNDPSLRNKKLVMYTSSLPDKCSNAAVLICGYMLLYHDKTPEEAYAPLIANGKSLPLVQYRDAGYGPATYWISVMDLLEAMQKGIKEQGLLDWDSFEVEDYEFYEKVENGDLNWIIPGFFLALATPHDEPPPHLLRYHQQVNSGLIQPINPARKTKKSYKPVFEIDPLLDYLSSIGIVGLVRLNNKLYDRKRVLDRGIDHYELYFPDGSVPPWDTILKKFMAIADANLPLHLINDNEIGLTEQEISERGALAVHCKAGLGRTGTLICCWMIKTFGWTARNCISWCRLMRPGSVVGPQQNWLESVEERLLEWGQKEREESFKKENPLVRAHSHTLAHDLAADVNDGTEALAEATNGMSVPIQPNKQERSRDNLSSKSENTADILSSYQKEYTLRSNTSKGSYSVGERLQGLYNLGDANTNLANLSIKDNAVDRSKSKRKISKSATDNPKSKFSTKVE